MSGGRGSLLFSGPLRDDAVDACLDGELRELLCLCFSDECFRRGRYCKEAPQHRWLVRDEGKLVAHCALHEKRVRVEGEFFAVGGLSEVCVHPGYRGRGLVREMVAEVADWSQERGFSFLLLFGAEAVYRSSGFVAVKNLCSEIVRENGEVVCGATTAGMVLPLRGTRWFEGGSVYLIGQGF